MGGVAESPAERDLGHRPAVGTLQILAAAREPLGADERRHRGVGVLEQSVQRAHRHGIGQRDRAWAEPGILQVGAHVATDVCPHRGALGGAIRRQARLDRGPQQLERCVRRRDARTRLQLRQLEGERVHVPDEQAGRSVAVQRRRRVRFGEARAEGEHLVTREHQRALVERFDDLDLGRLQAVPQHDVAGPQRDLAVALADELGALAHKLEPEDVLVAGRAAHPAAVEPEKR